MNEVDGHQNGGGQMAVAFESRFARNGRGAPEEICPPLKAQSGETGKGDSAPLVAFFSQNSRDELVESDVALSLKSGGGKPGQSYPAIRSGWAVRRLTPRECERLQGFPDDYTLVPWRNGTAADGPRYKTLGNSMACNAMRWLGRRIEMVNQMEAAA